PGMAEHEAGGERIGQAHLRLGQRIDRPSAAHVEEEAAEPHLDARDVAVAKTVAVEEKAEGVDGRMRAAAGRIGLERYALHAPALAEADGQRFRPGGGLGERGEEAAPAVLEDGRRPRDA